MIHSDLAYFKNTPSRGGKNCYVSFVDDFSRYTNIYLIKSKDETSSMFLKLKAESEIQLGKRIKRLISYRCGEYFDRTLKEYCESNEMIDESKKYCESMEQNQTLHILISSLINFYILIDVSYGI